MSLLIKLLVKISCVIGYHSWTYYWGKDGATRYCRGCHLKQKRVNRRSFYYGYDEITWIPTELSIQEKRDKNLSDILES